MFIVSKNPHIPLRFELYKQRLCSQLSKTSRWHFWLNVLEGQTCKKKYIPLYQRHSHYLQSQRQRRVVLLCLWLSLSLSFLLGNFTLQLAILDLIFKMLFVLFQHSCNHCTVTKFSSRHTHVFKKIRNLATQKKSKDG
jgi:hypothetical protein